MSGSPEERTTELWSLNFDKLERELRFRNVVLAGTNITIALVDLKPYSLAQNKKNWLYSPMQRMEAGDCWARYHYLRKMCLSLIVAKDDGQVGACVQIVKANRVDPESGKEVPLPKQGDIATYLRLGSDTVGRLRFIDSSERLYLVPTGRMVHKLADLEDSCKGASDADQALDKFFEDSKPL